MKEQNTEQLFKDALGNLEADVNPGVWTNIEHGLKTPVNVTGNTVASKSAGILGKLGLKSLLMITTASVTVIGTIVYFVTDKSEAKKTATTTLSTSEQLVAPSVINNKIETVPSDLPLKESKNLPVKKQFAVESNSGNDVAAANAVTDSHTGMTEKEPRPHSSKQTSSIATDASHPDDNFVTKDKQSAGKTDNVNKDKKEDDGQVDPNAGNVKAPGDPVFDAIEKYLVADAFGKKELRNSFSPNGDGKNDIFSLETTDIKSLEVIIFDLSGKQIYSWNSLNGGWDGTFSNGKEAPEGNYFYSVNAQTLDGKICIAKSSLRLFRNSQN